MHGFKSYLKIEGGVNKGINNKISGLLGLGVEGYELLHCNYRFYQLIDDKGKASTEVRGGEITIILDTLPTQELINWGLSRDKYHDGEIGLFSNDQDTGVIERLEFENAACTSFNLCFTEDGASFVKTIIVITAEVMKIGMEKVIKHWTEQ